MGTLLFFGSCYKSKLKTIIIILFAFYNILQIDTTYGWELPMINITTMVEVILLLNLTSGMANKISSPFAILIYSFLIDTKCYIFYTFLMVLFLI